MNKLSITLARLMSEEGISEQALSDKTGVQQSTIHRIRTGKVQSPRAGAVEALAKYFKLSPAEMRGEHKVTVDFKGMPKPTKEELVKLCKGEIELKDVETKIDRRMLTPTMIHWTVFNNDNQKVIEMGESVIIDLSVEAKVGEIGMFVIDGQPRLAQVGDKGLQYASNADPSDLQGQEIAPLGTVMYLDLRQ